MAKREHGGNLDDAVALHGGAREDWLDLSTGINPMPYPVPEISAAAWARLPEQRALERLLAAARGCYGVAETNAIVAASGVQSLIQLLPSQAKGSTVRVLSPTYNEYAATFRNIESFTVFDAAGSEELAGADVAIVVNPNNPDGRRFQPDDLLALAPRVGLLVVDEAFADPHPELSLCPEALPGNVIAMRSFGKFFGLAGLRLGFAVTHPDRAGDIEQRLGPWAVSGPAIEVGTTALRDHEWQRKTRDRLSNDMNRLLGLIDATSLEVVGGTDLFLTVAATDSYSVRTALAAERIWVRSFSYEPSWLRFGLPGDAPGWARLSRALDGP